MSNDTTLNQIEASVFRKLVAHLQAHPEVQNMELMLLARFCRNCLAKWYQEAAEENGVATDYAEALNAIYGMPYDQWKQLHQKPATAEQLAQFKLLQEKSQNTPE